MVRRLLVAVLVLVAAGSGLSGCSSRDGVDQATLGRVLDRAGTTPARSAAFLLGHAPPALEHQATQAGLPTGNRITTLTTTTLSTPNTHRLTRLLHQATSQTSTTTRHQILNTLVGTGRTTLTPALRHPLAQLFEHNQPWLQHRTHQPPTTPLVLRLSDLHLTGNQTRTFATSTLTYLTNQLHHHHTTWRQTRTDYATVLAGLTLGRVRTLYTRYDHNHAGMRDYLLTRMDVEVGTLRAQWARRAGDGKPPTPDHLGALLYAFHPVFRPRYESACRVIENRLDLNQDEPSPCNWETRFGW